MPGRFPPTAWLSLLAVFAALAVEGAAAADPPDCPPDASNRDAIVCEVNAARAAAGRAPLTSRPSLAAAARAHSADMVERRYFAHDSPEGEGRPIARGVPATCATPGRGASGRSCSGRAGSR